MPKYIETETNVNQKHKDYFMTTDKKPSKEDKKKDVKDDSLSTEHIEKLKEDFEKLKSSETEWKTNCLRACADMENLKKRTRLDIEKSEKYALGKFVEMLLPVLDSFERALSSYQKDSSNFDAFMAGIELTHKEFLDVLKSKEITPIDSLNNPFNPNFQKAIQEIEDASVPPQTVVQEIQKGYLIGGDRVLREALVIVSK
ncbi:MAG: nucleotide exchange factor GrpE [Alphaproteobacteria bacterium]|nr:nucleotide exchange factor GrpE [Alphaproteobacteria bacterium]